MRITNSHHHLKGRSCRYLWVRSSVTQDQDFSIRHREVVMRSIAAIGAVLLTIGLLFLQPPRLVMADEPKTDTVQRTPQPTSPAMTPARTEKPTPPAEAPHIQERGIFPGSVAPGLVGPKAPVQMTAPTSSLSAIQNAMRITSKSVSVNLRIPPNLPVTVPVEVKVFYSSPLKSKILTQTYNPTSGLTLSYRDVEGNGQPRPMNVVVELRELIPNGQVTSFNKQFTVTPLYDVFVTDLRFVMASKCDLVGKSDITFRWVSPDGQVNEQKFKLGEGEAKGITRFSWTRKEIAARDNLKEPRMKFFERDPNVGVDYHTPLVGPYIPMVPGPTTKYDFFLKNEATGPPGLRGAIGSNACVARVTYTIIKALMPFDQF